MHGHYSVLTSAINSTIPVTFTEEKQKRNREGVIQENVQPGGKLSVILIQLNIL